MKLETTPEKVLEAANNCPKAKQVLETLFPEVFENNKVFCEIGGIFFREQYPNNIYSIVKKGDRIVALNISHSAEWNSDNGKRNLPLNSLTDLNQGYITVTEFKKLTGYVNLDGFIVVPKSFNQELFKFTKNIASL